MFPEYSLVITAKVNTRIQADYSRSRHPASARPHEALDSGIGRRSFSYLPSCGLPTYLLSCHIQFTRNIQVDCLQLPSSTTTKEDVTATGLCFPLSSRQAQATGITLATLSLTPASQLATGFFCCAPHTRPAHLQITFTFPSFLFFFFFLFFSLPFTSSIPPRHPVLTSSFTSRQLPKSIRGSDWHPPFLDLPQPRSQTRYSDITWRREGVSIRPDSSRGRRGEAFPCCLGHVAFCPFHPQPLVDEASPQRGKRLHLHHPDQPLLCLLLAAPFTAFRDLLLKFIYPSTYDSCHSRLTSPRPAPGVSYPLVANMARDQVQWQSVLGFLISLTLSGDPGTLRPRHNRTACSDKATGLSPRRRCHRPPELAKLPRVADICRSHECRAWSFTRELEGRANKVAVPREPVLAHEIRRNRAAPPSGESHPRVP